MEISRKRCRTEIDERNRQQKYLVTSRLVEKNDKVLMEKIYEKTISLLFSGSRQQKSLNNSNTDSEILDKTLEDKIEDKLPNNSVGCKLCLNDIDATSENNFCSTCNLRICKACNFGYCSYCSKNICVNCVKIFGCYIVEDDFVTPICEDCKTYLG